MHCGDRSENATRSAYVALCGLAMTLTFDLLTSKSNQFIFVPNSFRAVRDTESSLTRYAYQINPTFSR